MTLSEAHRQHQDLLEAVRTDPEDELLQQQLRQAEELRDCLWLEHIAGLPPGRE